jgi:putative DNA primase/helicase
MGQEVVQAESKWLGISPEEAAHAEPQHLTDVGNAKRFARQHRDNVRFRHPGGDGIIWKNTHWMQDQMRELFRLAERTAASIYTEASNESDGEKRIKIVKWARTSEGIARLKAMIELASSESDLSALVPEFDSNPMLLNCANGTLDLERGVLRPHQRADLITKIVPVDYMPGATCPRWMAFLDEITGGRMMLKSFLQRTVGYVLTGSTQEQLLFFLMGPGASGKSTFLEALRMMLGDFAAQTDFSTLLGGSDTRIRNDLARLVGKRLATAAEVGRGQQLAEVVAKQITGGDMVSARFLYKEYFEFVPQFKLFIAANHFPRSSADDDALWRRILVIPFDVSIPPARRDKTLLQKLREELPGILAWAVEGCMTWQRDGLNAPTEVLNASRDRRDDQDSIGSFLNTFCILDPRKVTLATVIYAAYRTYCSDVGLFCESQRRFGSSLGKRGLQSTRHGATGRCAWIGIGLK